MHLNPAVLAILIATAIRLETVGWAEGGSMGFRLMDRRFRPDVPLCLLDSLGYMAWTVASETDVYLPDGMEGLTREMRQQVIPVIYRVILAQPCLDTETRRNLEFPSPLPEITEAGDRYFGAVSWYNDFVIKSGHEAAGIIRGTAKEITRYYPENY